jgi:pyrimidine deaminase RibD-like protein
MGFAKGLNPSYELKRLAMHPYHRDRRYLVSALALAALSSFWRATPATAQSAAGAQPLWQPPEPTKAAFLARARALRDQAVREGDQAYGAVVVRDGVIVGEGRNYVVLQSDPTAHSELLAVRDAARRLGTRDLSDCDVYSTAMPCPMCQGALYWGRVRRVFTESTLAEGFAPKLGC